MRRILLLFLAALALFWWLGRLLRGLRGPAEAPRPSASASTATGPMVRDRICNTFLPKSKALRIEAGAEEHFFCSERCRDRFLARPQGPPDDRS